MITFDLKKITYYGQELYVPTWANYIGVSSDSYFFVNDIKPELLENALVNNWSIINKRLFKVALNGTDWRETLQYIGPEQELKPCPHCGSEIELQGDTICFMVVCDCGYRFAAKGTKQEAIERINTRVKE